MKRILYIGLLLFIVNNCFTQNITVTGFVRDVITLSPVKDVNILIKGSNTGITTDASGFFSIEMINYNEIIIVSHISYKKQEIKDYKKTYPLEILLQPKVIELSGISINSDPIINLTKDLPIYVKDYVFIDKNICLLAYNKKKINDIRLYYIDKDANILSELKIEKAESLFKDCFGYIYYLDSDDAINISVTKDSITEINRIPRNYFDISYKALEFKIEDNIYFSTNHYKNFIKKYHYINLYDEEREIHTILSIADSNKISEFERDFNFFYYAKKASKTGMSITSVYNNLYAIRELQALDWEDQHGRFSALEVSVNNLRDSIYVFNYIRGYIEVYNLNGVLKRKEHTTFFKDVCFTGKIIVSEESCKMYAVYKNNAVIQLREIDLLNGGIKTRIDIPFYPFIENMKLCGNQLYFLYKKKIKQELKQLYRLELI